MEAKLPGPIGLLDEKVHVYVVSAHRDSWWLKQLESQLILMKRFSYINSWHNFQTGPDPFPKDQVDDRLEEADLIIYLMSPDLVASNYFYGKEVRLAITQHQLKRAVLVPVYLRDLGPEFRPFKSIPSLPKDQDAIKNAVGYEEEIVFRQVIEELKEITYSIKKRKSDIIRTWNKASQANSEEAYQEFLREFPYSFFSTEARLRMEELEEKRLWQEAVDGNCTNSYLNYLADSPLNKHESEAVKKIQAFEQNEEEAWKDAQNHEEIALVARYINWFPKGKYIKDARKRLKEMLNNDALFEIQFDEEEEDGPQLKVEGCFLDYAAAQRLTSPEEKLKYDLFDDYVDGLEGRIYHAINEDKTWQFYASPIFGFLLFFQLLFFLDYLNRKPINAEDTDNLLGFIGWLLIWGMIDLLGGAWLWSFQTHINHCNNQIPKLREKDIALKVALIAGKRDKAQANLQAIYDIERKTVLRKPNEEWIKFIRAVIGI